MNNTSNQVHLINPLTNPYGGSERRAVGLYNTLKNTCEPLLWSEYESHPYFSDYPINKISLADDNFPRNGTIVIVGNWFPIGIWIHKAKPERTILIYNTYVKNPILRYRIHFLYWRLSHFKTRNVEMVYASSLMQNELPYPGIVQVPPIDLSLFQPVKTRLTTNHFTIGRLSRDEKYKHHEHDPDFYQELTTCDSDIQIKLMGATCISQELTNINNITIMPTGSEEAHLFLQSLDCFYYRTSNEITEGHGRVVTEAMACGIPVVCHNNGGYIDFIKHGYNGFLFETQDQAKKYIIKLKADPELRAYIGHNARCSMEALSKKQRIEQIKYYCS
jgi:glycosyltransferase involved in cell wall biosynthesis